MKYLKLSAKNILLLLIYIQSLLSFQSVFDVPIKFTSVALRDLQIACNLFESFISHPLKENSVARRNERLIKPKGD